jgi:hypothetical protein
MPNKIKPKRSYTANSVPLTTDLETHELAINWTDGKAFTKNAAGSIVSVTLGGTGGGGEDTVLRSFFLPPAPTSVSATATNAQAVVTWTAPAVVVPPITDYIVQFSSNSGSSWTTFSDGTSTATSATVTGLTNGTAYTFRVAGVNGIGTGAYSTASAAVTPEAGDAYFSNVSLLLPFNGNLTDASSSPKTMTAFGDAAATGVAKFGSASLALDGTGDYLTTPSSTDFDLPGDFVIETWVRLTAPPSSFAGAYGAAVVSRYTGAGQEANKGFQLRINGTASEYDTINFYTGVTDLNFSTAVALNTWHHVAVARSGSSLRVYLNGSQVGSTVTNSDSLTPTSSRSLSIGRLALETVYLFDLPGQIDDLRITKGSARGYTGATITVPTAAFPTS